jgi:hypothetical protein
MMFLRNVFVIVLTLLHVHASHSIGGDNLNGSTIKIYSQILDEERVVSVSVPQGYEDDRKAYPVLYILDAEGDRTFPQCVSTVSDLSKEGLLPEMVIVGIWNTVRNRDMIPVSVSHRPGSGGSERFLCFIKDELMPYIKKNYRITDFSLLYGMSNSALFAVYALLEKPATFNAYIASSPMIGHCPEYMREKAEVFVKRDQIEGRILFMIYGTEDSQRVTQYVPDFQKYLDSHAPKEFISHVEILEGEGHVPAGSLIRGLRSIFSFNQEK